MGTDRSESIAKKRTRSYVPSVIRIEITDMLQRKCVVEMRPLSVGMMLHIDHIRAAELASVSNGQPEPPNMVAIDQARFSITAASGDALTGPPDTERITVLDEPLDVPTRRWMLAQSGSLVDALVKQMAKLATISEDEHLKLDFA